MDYEAVFDEIALMHEALSGRDGHVQKQDLLFAYINEKPWPLRDEKLFRHMLLENDVGYVGLGEWLDFFTENHAKEGDIWLEQIMQMLRQAPNQKGSPENKQEHSHLSVTSPSAALFETTFSSVAAEAAAEIVQAEVQAVIEFEVAKHEAAFAREAAEDAAAEKALEDKAIQH